MLHDVAKAWFLSPLLWSCIAVPSVAQERPAAAAHSTLRIGFVGASESSAPEQSARRDAFTEFLRARFARVETWSREDFDLRQAGLVDVVVLDWPQDEGALRWFRGRNGGAGAGAIDAKSPLGPRESWHTPTVLLGSAGLSLAHVWRTHGSYG